jgi:tRNA A37 threonylcarbamoyladenosine dehydratase
MAFRKLNKETFYKEFTLNNSGLISSKEQMKLRYSTILVAGCGSTGGGVIELLVRSGAEKLILIDDGLCDLNNANRQNMTLDDVGEFKADVLKQRCYAINPFLEIETCNIGVTPDNVTDFVNRADIVIDAIDLKKRSGIEAKYLLHQFCHDYQKPVICGYDMAATQYISIFDYRNSNVDVLDNIITTEMIATMDPLKLCAHLVPLKYIPEDMFEELERGQQGKKFISKLGMTANLFGTMATALVIDMLNNKPVESEYCIDIWSLIRGEYQDKAKINVYRDSMAQWKGLPDEIDDRKYLQRSIENFKTPCFQYLLNDRKINKFFYVCESNEFVGFAIPHYKIEPHLARKLLRYAFVNYSKDNYINKKVASSKLMHTESLDDLSLEDTHIIILEKITGRLMAYSTLKAPIDKSIDFSEKNRIKYSVEEVFGADVFDNTHELKKYSLEQVREITRVVKTSVDNKELLAKIGIMLLVTIRYVICDPRNNIKAVVGDGEINVTLKDLRIHGFNPKVLSESRVSISENHLYYNRYKGRNVFAFWFETKSIDPKRSLYVESLLTLDGGEFIQKYKQIIYSTKRFKSSLPFELEV